MESNSTKKATTSLNQSLIDLSSAESECRIYRVHRHLRKVNPKAYDPEVIAIGPYHHDNEHLKKMEHQKLRYLQQLLHQKSPPDSVERYVEAIGKEEAKARRCYAELPETLTPDKFIRMLVLDGCFIVQLVRKYEKKLLHTKIDPIFQRDWMMNSVMRDLMLFENQIPFFVLCKLYDLIEFPGQHSRLLHLLFKFFSVLYPGKGYKELETVDPLEVKHLLDFIHCSWLPPSHDSGSGGGRKDREVDKMVVRFIDSAKSLEEANVKFEKSEENMMFNVGFKEGVMTMARLTIDDRTESFLRNLIAYEQYFKHSFVTDYVKFLDCIIDSSKDVEILSRRGIIENWLGDENEVAEMVNKLSESVSGPGKDFVYANMFEDVNKHCGRRWNRWMANLRKHYFNNPWTIISVLVALVLLLLTFTQTVFSILQVVLKSSSVNIN